jgi:carboxypeptidase Taq
MTTFDRFLERARTIADLGAASSTLNWDQETLMPPKAATGRAEQLATIDSLIHTMVTSEEYGELIAALTGDGQGLESWQRSALREARRNRDRATKLPTDFVAELSRTQSLGQHAWKEAREKSDFALFAPILEKLVELKRREAAYYGADENLYDALIDDYEPGMTVRQLAPVFERLKEGTSALLKRISDSGVSIDNSFWYREFEGPTQLEVARNIVERLGFDFGAGRVDLSAHPFCTSFGIDDVRLTTRIRPEEPAACIYGLIHEAGHGMYEQGIDRRFARTPLATGVSMGIHESQSLFWENMIGRSEAFWTWAFPIVSKAFPKQLSGLDPHRMFRAVNVMKPSFIRVEADELTYNLHIVMRYELENSLINGEMEVAQIPSEWNRRMDKYLGIVPPNDALGCLQDVHWSFGLFGYFPSYTLGKLYSAMFFNQMQREVPDLAGSISRGDFSVVLGWLREKIHHLGRSVTATELVTKVCARPLTEVDFLDYISDKISRVYTSG